MQEKSWRIWRVANSSWTGSTSTYWELVDQPSRILAKTLWTASSSCISWTIWIQINAHSLASKNLMMRDVLNLQSTTPTDLVAKMSLPQETSAKETTRSTKSLSLRSLLIKIVWTLVTRMKKNRKMVYTTPRKTLSQKWKRSQSLNNAGISVHSLHQRCSLQATWFINTSKVWLTAVPYWEGLLRGEKTPWSLSKTFERTWRDNLICTKSLFNSLIIIF